MNFIHVEDFFHPDAGYQLNLLSKIQVSQGHNVTIITSELENMPEYLTAFFKKDHISEKDNAFTQRTGVRIIRIPLLGYYSGRSIYSSLIFKTIDAIKPDVLFVHGEDTLIGVQLIWRSIWKNYPIVLDCHMLEMASENRFRKLFRLFYRTFVTPIIIRKKIPLIRVVDSDYVQKCLGIPLEKTALLSFGTDTSHYQPSYENSLHFRTKHNIRTEDFVVVYAGKLDVFKGGLFLANSLRERFYLANGRKIVFVIVGNAAGSYGEEVEKKFAESENTIMRFDTQTYYDLAYFYQAADLSVFPKQCSMSFFEVQSTGLPVLMEDNEINNDRVKFGNGSTFIPGDIPDFRSKIQHYAEMVDGQYDLIKSNSRSYITDNFDYSPIAQKFTDIMIKENKRFN